MGKWEDDHIYVEFMEFVEEKVGITGVTISVNDRNNRFRPPWWSVRGCGVNASGAESMTEAIYQWMEAVKYLKERDKREQ